MGDFVCTDESLSDTERFELKWGERLAAGRAAKAGVPAGGVSTEASDEEPGAGERKAAGEGDQPERPADTASKADWVDYAVARGARRDVAETATRAALIAEYGQTASA